MSEVHPGSAHERTPIFAVRVWLLGLALVATAGHVWLVDRYHGPWVFYDELGYQKLAQSLGQTGQLALFSNHGLSYSPLYSLVLSPLYALHISGPAAYQWTKIVNCLLMSVAIVPIYKIARFVLPPRRAVVAAGLCLLAPLMLYSSLVLSENLGYPLSMCAIWAMLVTIRSPSARNDAVLLVVCFVATAARLQFVVLFPAALGAVLLDAIIERREPGSLRQRVLRVARAHWLLTAATAVTTIVGLAAAAGTSVVSITGRYSNESNLPFPSPWRIIELFVEHLAGLDFAVGVIPFVGTLVAAYLWVRRGARREVSVFAVVGLSVTFALLLMTAFVSYGVSYASPGHGDLPRIHERYLFYLVPLFVIAMFAVTGTVRTTAMVRLGLGAALVTALLPALIPWTTVMNNSVAADSFGLAAFAARAPDGGIKAIAHCAVLAVLFAWSLSFAYALARPKRALIVALVALVFVWMSALAQNLLNVGASSATAHTFAGRRDWVDAASPGGSVALVDGVLYQGPRAVGVVETEFFNLSITRLYYPCQPILSSEFGEDQVVLDSRGRLRDRKGLLHVRSAVVPSDGGVQGRVLALEPRAHLALVEPADGILRVAANRRARWAC